ncbi:MAG TPA: ATPase [Firmicutes bacterium]|nr:ATPase [Bacillota bacterium]
MSVLGAAPGPEALLDRMERVVADAARVPFSHKVLVDQEQLFALLDELRAHLPQEITQARTIIHQKEEILQQARWEAEQIVSAAREAATRQAADHELVKLARDKADKVVQEARQVAGQIKEGAYDYALDILGQLERSLTQALDTIRRGKAELKGPSPGRPQAGEGAGEAAPDKMGAAIPDKTGPARD